MSSNNSVLVVMELDENNDSMPISLECISTGGKLARELNAKLFALVMGSDIGRAAEELRHYGIDEIYTADNRMLQYYQPDCYIAAFEQAYQNINPRAIIMGATLRAIDFAPRLAFRLKIGLVADCVKVELLSDEFLFTKPVYSGNIMASYSVKHEPAIATMRSRVVEPARRSNTISGRIVPVDVKIDPSIIKTEVIERIVSKEEGLKLQEAEIVIAGGRGIGGPEGFAMLADLAVIMNAAVGSSRPPCDLGWVDPSKQVGQTGEIIGPPLYIAVGISGSIQHFAGMSGSKTIVAINKDEKANIFDIADYGVVGNYEDVIPAFRDKIVEIMKQG